MPSTFSPTQFLARFHVFETPTGRPTILSSTCHQSMLVVCTLSMNGCQGDPKLPVGTIQTRTLRPIPTPALAMDSLASAIAHLNSDPPSSSSGIIRIQVPIEQQIEAIEWLHSQLHQPNLPRFFFSGRKRNSNGSNFFINYHNGNINGNNNNNNGSLSNPTTSSNDLISVAGIGAAIHFRHSRPFDFLHWKSIKRFLSESCPLIRAYGTIRFDAKANVSEEWEPFGSFYFMVPQVEFDELEGRSLFVANIAWDDSLSWSWRMAVDHLLDVLDQVTFVITKFEKDVPKTSVSGDIFHVPDEKDWHIAVKKALHMITMNSSILTKVVLARSSRIFTTSDIDPVAWLACLRVEGDDAYQFLLQPPNAPAFIGNTPEQLFHRKKLDIWSEALAGTRARCESKALDDKTSIDLLSSPKDHLEFTIVRECIRKKMEAVCDSVLMDPKKAIRKLPRVQHLYARLQGRLRNEDNEPHGAAAFLTYLSFVWTYLSYIKEFDVLSSLHPSPAVCGFPTEEARCLITETEKFDRGMYAGPVGWFGGEEAEFAVGIRSALVKQGLGAFIYAGTGIVEGSDPTSEWEELELKIMQFTKLLRLEVPLWIRYGFFHLRFLLELKG